MLQRSKANNLKNTYKYEAIRQPDRVTNSKTALYTLLSYSHRNQEPQIAQMLNQLKQCQEIRVSSHWQLWNRNSLPLKEPRMKPGQLYMHIPTDIL